ncbi:hypothetical protein [Haloglycomyces albus]|uniref:hypothetical protein n=1 Tax=Haloglycomyces albus TaxID=526067 RepID=UPI00046C9238|nr:hypothetical protein [Haloglycomyces albus]
MAVMAGAAGIIWGILALLKVHPKAQAVLLVFLGAGAGGLLGEWIGRLAAFMVRAVDAGTGWAIGMSLGWGLALGVLLFWVIIMLPNNVEPVGLDNAKWIRPTLYISSVFLWPFVMLLGGGLQTMAATVGV